MSKDIFSKQASLYAGYRPSYPPALIEHVLSQVARKDLAWDCATGNGQVAILLAPHFRKVMATDLSSSQILHAIPHPSIEYQVCGAEQTPFPDNYFDLITVGQAYHWFHHGNFIKEANRTAKAGCIIAVWCYTLAETPDRGIRDKLDHFYRDVVGPFWDPERKHVDDHYMHLPFPFREFPAASFREEVRWTLQDLIGYLRTWSGVQRYIESNGNDPVASFERELRPTWTGDEARPFSFPLYLRMGRVEK